MKYCDNKTLNNACANFLMRTYSNAEYKGQDYKRIYSILCVAV